MTRLLVTRVFEQYGIYVSIRFCRNLDREPAWGYVIETIEDELEVSVRYGSYEEAERQALKKAVDFI